MQLEPTPGNFCRWSLPATVQKMNLCKKLRTLIKERLVPQQNPSRLMEHKENCLHFSTSVMFVRTQHSPLEDLWDLALPLWRFLGNDCVRCHLGSVMYVTPIYGFVVFEPYHCSPPKSRCFFLFLSLFFLFSARKPRDFVCRNFWTILRLFF